MKMYPCQEIYPGALGRPGHFENDTIHLVSWKAAIVAKYDKVLELHSKT